MKQEKHEHSFRSTDSDRSRSAVSSRRQFLGHAGALGLGSVFLPFAASVARASALPVEEERAPGLIFETFEAGGIAHYSYFIGDALSGTAVVIDPKRDVDDYLALAARHRLKITHALETHIHADFVSGSRELNHRTGAVICASIEGGAEYGFAIQPLRDGAVIKSGNIRLKAIHTPGHTPEHMSYLVSTRANENRPWALFTGDFIFAGSVGRPDLMGVENTERLARLLYESLQSAFKDLPDKLPIYPAHGPGSPCGAGIVARDGIPTLGIERESNPALQFDDRDAFIEELLRTQPPVPYYWPRMKVVNARGPAVLGELPEPQRLDPRDFERLLRGNVQLLDTRNMLAFGGGHIRGALNIGHAPSVSMWGGWLLDPQQPVALVTPSQANARDAVAWLVRIGVEKFAGVLDGGMDKWTLNAGRYESIPQLSVHALRDQIGSGDLQVVDVRQPSEWDQGHLPNARYMFLPEIPKRARELDRDRRAAVYCGTGYRASIAASLLKREGFDVASVPGSFDAWLAAGYQVVVPASRGRASDTRRS